VLRLGGSSPQCEHKSTGVSTTGSRNQATSSEDYNKLRILVCYRDLCSVGMSYKSPVNQIVNPNPVYSH
jgi:hypothetical protein